MVDSLQLYQEIKGRADSLRREADRAQGQLDVKKAELKKEFNCTTSKEAKAKLETLEAEELKAEKAFKKAIKEFEEEWGHELES